MRATRSGAGDQRAAIEPSKVAPYRRAGAEHWEDEVAHELFAQVVDEDVPG
jgi:hypothetical protein